MGSIYMVTGVAGALGRAVVETLLATGARIIGVDTAPILSPWLDIEYVGGLDLAHPSSAASLFEGGRMPLLDGLINVAGGFAWETLHEGSIAQWESMLRTNLLTAVTMSKAALPALRRSRGAIVNVGAAATLQPSEGMGAYSASKSGVAMLTRVLAEEERRFGVRVNAVLPSIIDTPANRRDLPDADRTSWVAPVALADVIAFLVSKAARAVTGACIPVTGAEGTAPEAA